MSRAAEIAYRYGGKRVGDHYVISTPGHSARDRGTILFDRADGGVIVHSFNSDWRETRDALGLGRHEARSLTRAEQRRFAQEREKEAKRRLVAQLSRAAALWEAGVVIEPGCCVRNYLDSRGIPASTAALAVSGGALRAHSDERSRFSMLALACAPDGRPRAVQMTKLRGDGGGKRGDLPRITFGPSKNTAVRLLPPVSGELAICEGVETALAFYALHKTPAWAALGTANLEAFTPPNGLQRLYIAADGDEAGSTAAQGLFDRLRQRIRCTLAIAPRDKDWADVLAESREAARV